MNDTCRALWSRHEPGTVVVADPRGEVVALLQVKGAYARPSPLMLAGTDWACYPGSSWVEEDSPGDGLGEWSVAVFRDARRRTESGPGHAR